MIKIAFSTIGCPDWTWDDLLHKGPAYGYDGVEIRVLARETDLLSRPEFQPSELPARRRELSEAGFQVCGLGSSVRFDYPDKQQRDEQIEIGKAYLDLAAQLGASFVRVFGDVVPAESESARRQAVIGNIAEGFQQLGEHASQAGLAVLVETHGDFADSRIVQETLSRVKSRAVGVLWDTHHPWRFFGEELATTFGRLQPWVQHTHWKDSVLTREPGGDHESAAQQAAVQAHALMSGHRHADYVLFGGGEFPAVECARLLRESGYDGWISLEWEKLWHPELDDPEIALPLFPEKMRWLWSAVDLTLDADE